MKNMFKICALMFFIVLNVNAAELIEKTKELQLSAPLVEGKAIPWFALMNAEDGFSPVNLNVLKQKAKELNAEKVVFTYFATWCIPCRYGVSKLKEFAPTLEEQKVMVVLINVAEEDLKKINLWVNKFGPANSLVLLDAFENISKGWGFYKEGEPTALPRTLILDKDFKVLKLYGEEGKDWPQVLWADRSKGNN